MPASLPIISVIVPHLNQMEALRRCLKSLERQTYPREHFEVVVVDNGSKILPCDVVATFPNARLEQEARPGPGPARNRGVATSHGEILAFIDADCLADQDWLSVLASGLSGGNVKRVIGGDVRIAVEDPNRLTQLEAYESIFAYRQEEYIKKFGFSGTGNLAVRRKDFYIIGPFAGIDVAEDREWGRRAKSIGYEIVYLPQMIVFHPARTSFAELFEKWDRHIDHDVADFKRLRFASIRWVTFSIALALSPALELPRILRSRRVFTMRDRWLATSALIRIRLYRAKVMLAGLGRGGRDAHQWNRKTPINPGT